ncbi:autotransporter-associated beta strand repeat-containing protein [Acidiphilium sp. JA12-A1]|uniref:autotransporter-associated beta strand repeat-containing protein n=1 Tax=Acidiphilium sp. JA12-A1 TaxID=1464546 RepID=UPI001396284D|nr:autotransporter domain-containing protein [Acidiphilium sp. JA12-A1]
MSDGIGGAGGNGGNGNLLLSILSTSPGGTGGSGGSVGSNATQIDNAGAVAGGAGNAGTDGTGTLNLLEGGGGGGGGAGGSGLVVTGSGSSSNSTTGTITGGAGGHGGSGDAGGNSGGGGGGGGSGGVGLLLTGDGSFDNAGQLAGGTGGFGGTTDNGGGGAGGDGGLGAALTNGGSLINSGSISGGNGGIGGASTGGNGSVGNGGAAITGTNLSIINSGTISGGLSGNGSTRAEAIQFTGGTNSLEIRTGSNIIGDVNATAGTNALILGGTVNDSFDTSTIGSQYLGFSAYRKTGNGTWALTGSTSAVTPWTIDAGTLSISAAGSLGAAGSSLTFNGGTLQFSNTFDLASGNAIVLAAGGGSIDTNTFDTSISQPVSGTGNLMVYGLGQLTLAGANTYSGTTTIGNATTLSLGPGGAIADSSGVVDNGTFDISATSHGASVAGLTGTGTVYLGNQTLTLTSASGTFSGNISGRGGLVLTGGTETLAGTSTYAGNTSITAGTLALAGASSIASSSSVIDNGRFDISGASGNETIAALTGSGAGTVALGANNLIISNGSGTFAGTIAGTGGLQLAGGTTTLAGTSTYAGNTSITGGTLLVSNDSALGAAGGNLLLSSGGTLGAMSPFGTARLIDVANTGGSLAGPAGTSLDPTTANALTLTGTLNLAGTLTTRGTVIDNATSQTNTGTGSAPVVTVANGLFEVGDSIHVSTVLHARVTVDASAILRGHGTIAGDVANNGGIVAPGGTIGVMTVTGNYAQNPASTLSIEITPNDQAPGISYSQLAVTGSVQLAGGLAVNADSGIYRPGSRYDIVHSGGGVSGQFSTVAYNSALASYLLPQVQYTADNVYLSLNVGPLAFSSGSGVAGNAYIINQDILDTTDAVLASRKGFWLHGLGSFGQANNGNITDGGAIIGYGARIRPGFLLGVAVAGTASSSNTAYQQISNRQISLSEYGIYRHGPWRIALTLGLGHLGVNSRRSLAPSGLVATGTGHGWFLGSGVNASYTDHIDRGFIRPFVAARYLHVSQEGFAEHGAGLLDLAYGRQGNDLGAIGAGARAGYQIRTFGLDLEPWIEVGGTSYLGNRLLASTETLGTETMPVSAQAAPSATLDTGLGLTLRTQHGWKGRLVYISRRGDNTSLNAFNFTATCNW